MFSVFIKFQFILMGGLGLDQGLFVHHQSLELVDVESSTEVQLAMAGARVSGPS